MLETKLKIKQYTYNHLHLKIYDKIYLQPNDFNSLAKQTFPKKKKKKKKKTPFDPGD